MITNKRTFECLESPEVSTLKRRCFREVSNSPVAWGSENHPHHTHLNGNKRRREFEDLNHSESSEVAKLRAELARMREEAFRKVAQAELVNHNLKMACEEQQKELQRMQQENKLLKRSIIAFNAKREEAERENASVKNAASNYLKRIQELEQANMMLCMRQRGPALCGQGNWDGSGSGPIC